MKKFIWEYTDSQNQRHVPDEKLFVSLTEVPVVPLHKDGTEATAVDFIDKNAPFVQETARLSRTILTQKFFVIRLDTKVFFLSAN